MIELINIYNDEQSAIIIDETTTNLIGVEKFTALGNSPYNSDNIRNNDNFIELYVKDENDTNIVTLNSARPLLVLPSTGKYYFDDYHYHSPTQTYMTGLKHSAIPHETLEAERENQLIPYSLEDKFLYTDNTSLRKFAIKTSEIFSVLKKLPNYNLRKNTKFKISYGIFQDVFLKVRTATIAPGATQ